MFDIQTEAYLRRTHPRDDDQGASPVIAAVVGANLVLWTTVLIAAL